MQWQPLDTWTVIIGALSAMSCALLGNFLVLRRLSMMGDAISHAVLPGLAIAFLITHSRASVPMFIGAAAIGVLTAVLTQWINRFGRVDESASMGVVFTTLFAIGLILIVYAADLRGVDLDPGCVLYGAIELTPLDTVSLLGLTLPRAAVYLGAMLLFNALLVLLLFKELRISAFDPALATTLGINATLMHYLLMVLVAATTVASFESVGSILVIAMLIAPPAAAHLLTDRLGSMIGVSLFIAVLCALLGHWSAGTVPRWLGHDGDTRTAGMMASVAGLIFFGVMLAAPRHGVVSKLVHRASLALRIVREDILGILYRLEELQPAPTAAIPRDGLRRTLTAGPLLIWLATTGLRARGQVQLAPAGLRLTPAGRDRARTLLRSHRLWESYLAGEANLPPDHTHASAERLEHITDPVMRQRLTETTAQPQTDPQGKPIPRES